MNKAIMTSGPIFSTLVKFSLPMIIVSILQMLFHTADTAVLGIMSGDAEVAAVGACGSLISLLLCLVMGYAGAANVVVSKRIGARDIEGARQATGTALVLGVLSGVLLMVVVVSLSRYFLIWTNCQPEILDMADLYMKIYFLGMPITMLYNFTASILRASGDSVSPMIYMIISGVANVLLNIVLVAFFDMTVDGVALATVLSNFIALTLSIIKLTKNKDYCKIEAKNLRLRKNDFTEMIYIGFPSCLAGLSFYLGEVIVVSAVNSISMDAMTANAISSQIDRVNYTVGSAIASANGVIVAQNFGARNFDRIKKIITVGSIYCMAVTMLLGVIEVVLADVFIGIFTDSNAIVELTKDRLILVALTNFITTNMEIFSNSVRTLKRARMLFVVGLTCGLGIRGAWALFIWPLCPTLPFLFVCFPLSTLIGTIIHAITTKKSLKREEILAQSEI